MIFLDGQTGAKQKNTVWKPINHFPSDFLGLQVIVTFQFVHSYAQFTCSPFVLVSKLDFFFALPFMKSKRNLCCFFFCDSTMNKRETRMYNPQHDRCVELQLTFILASLGLCALQVAHCRCLEPQSCAGYTAHHASHHLQLQVG